MTDHADIEALERWLHGFADPQLSALDRDRIKSAVRSALSAGLPLDRTGATEVRSRIKHAVRSELAATRARRGGTAPHLLLATSGLAAAAVLGLMSSLMVLKPASLTEDETVAEFATLQEEDPDLAPLEAELDEFELWTAAQDYYRETHGPDDLETLRLLEVFISPAYHLDLEELNS